VPASLTSERYLVTAQGRDGRGTNEAAAVPGGSDRQAGGGWWGAEAQGL